MRKRTAKKAGAAARARPAKKARAAKKRGKAPERGKPLFDRVAIIGVGLIGSSLARVINREHLARHVVGCARRPDTLKKIRDLKLAQTVTWDPAEAVRDADLVMLCVPVGSNREIAKAIGPHLKPGAIVSDVGSVKQSVIADIAPFLPKTVHFVPGHPVAGTEYSGPEAGFAELFEGRFCILTPPPGTDKKAVARVAEPSRSS